MIDSSTICLSRRCKKLLREVNKKTTVQNSYDDEHVSLLEKYDFISVAHYDPDNVLFCSITERGKGYLLVRRKENIRYTITTIIAILALIIAILGLIPDIPTIRQFLLQL